jgi:hypothetical protein
MQRQEKMKHNKRKTIRAKQSESERRFSRPPILYVHARIQVAYALCASFSSLCVRKLAYIISHTPHHTGTSRFPPQLWRDCTGPITSIVMAQRPREDVVDHVPVQPTPPPSFLSLSDLAHHTIASFLSGHSRDCAFPRSHVRCSSLMGAA